jgi:cell shape-determining protein MreC
MARKQTKVSKRMLFTWFMLAGFILLFTPQNLTGNFQLAFTRIFRWPLSIGGNIALTARAQQPLQDAWKRRESQLENHIANLEETLLQQRREFQKQYGLYNDYVWEGADFASADIITRSIDGSRNELTIDCRKDVTLAKDQFVLGDNCIIGTISDASSGTASVKLFTDPTSSMPVRIAGLPTIMRGSGNSLARIEMVSDKVKRRAEVEEKVFALKKPRFLDASMIIGKVVKCERNDKNALLWDIMVEPACDMEKLENVSVIIMSPQK